MLTSLTLATSPVRTVRSDGILTKSLKSCGKGQRLDIRIRPLFSLGIISLVPRENKGEPK
jgi:hypothetical protein